MLAAGCGATRASIRPRRHGYGWSGGTPARSVGCFEQQFSHQSVNSRSPASGGYTRPARPQAGGLRASKAGADAASTRSGTRTSDSVRGARQPAREVEQYGLLGASALRSPSSPALNPFRPTQKHNVTRSPATGSESARFARFGLLQAGRVRDP